VNGPRHPTKISIGQVLRVRPPEIAAQCRWRRRAARAASKPASRLGAQQGRGDGAAKTEPRRGACPYSRENVAILSKEDKPDAEAIAFNLGRPRARSWPDSPSRETRASISRAGSAIRWSRRPPVGVTYSGTASRAWASWSSSSTDNGFITCTRQQDIRVKEQQAWHAARRSRRSAAPTRSAEAELPDPQGIGRRRSDALFAPRSELRAAPGEIVDRSGVVALRLYRVMT